MSGGGWTDVRRLAGVAAYQLRRVPVRSAARERGLHQRRGGGALGDRHVRIAIHPDRQAGAVVDHLQLAGQRLRVTRAGLRRELSEQAADVGAVGLGGEVDAAAGWRLGGRHRERAAVERRPAVQLRLGVEHGQDPLHRVVAGGGDRGAQPPEDHLVTTLEVGADQLLLGAERAVQRGLGDAGAFDHAVDPDRLHALGVEQLGRGVEQPLTGRALDRGAG